MSRHTNEPGAEEAGGTAGPSCQSRSKPEALPRPWRPLCRATATCSVRPAPSLLSVVSSTGKQHGFTLRPVLPAASGPHQVLIPVQPQVRLQVNCLKNRSHLRHLAVAPALAGDWLQTLQLLPHS